MQWWTDPDWWQVGLTILGAWFAVRAFNHERDAVRLTQRADVLLERIRIKAGGQPTLSPESVFIFHFTNFGPTRANDLIARIRWQVGDHAMKPAPSTSPMALGGTETYRMRFPPIGTSYDDALIRQIATGEIQMTFRAEVNYTDVFGKPHGYTWRGSFNPDTQRLDMENGQETKG